VASGFPFPAVCLKADAGDSDRYRRRDRRAGRRVTNTHATSHTYIQHVRPNNVFDTLLLNYVPRRHRMVLATIAQRYAAMQGLQQQTSVKHPQDARFVMNANLHVDSMAEALRLHG
jgi:hypothetical protein